MTWNSWPPAVGVGTVSSAISPDQGAERVLTLIDRDHDRDAVRPSSLCGHRVRHAGILVQAALADAKG